VKIKRACIHHGDPFGAFLGGVSRSRVECIWHLCAHHKHGAGCWNRITPRGYRSQARPSSQSCPFDYFASLGCSGQGMVRHLEVEPASVARGLLRASRGESWVTLTLESQGDVGRVFLNFSLALNPNCIYGRSAISRADPVSSRISRPVLARSTI
jgi:hypothetical protein